MNFGVVEGFFGPAWPLKDRLEYAEFLKNIGGQFYIYAPKQDQHLRKAWREKWDQKYLSELALMAEEFHRHGIEFGVALSPFALGQNLNLDDKKHLQDKLTLLTDVGVDILGVFFDDMPVTQNLSTVQIEVMDQIHQYFKKKIVFCPSFYCFDPILDKVFGKKPEGYLEHLAEKIPSDVAMAWTGPKVISPEISISHLKEVTKLLKRKPFIWENFFANDGPKNCKFLKLKPFIGREVGVDHETEGWSFNMMNQPQLSMITLLASKKVLDGSPDSTVAFDEALREKCTKGFATFIQKHAQDFLNLGLDQISQEQKDQMLEELSGHSDPSAREVEAWLKGDYVVGSECLTD